MTIILDDHRTFDHVQEMNEALRLHLRQHRYNLTPTAIKTLEVVSRHAVKYVGAAWLKIDTLAVLIGKSTATARRALALLQKLGIIERVPFMRRVRGGNGANLLRVLPADDWASTIGRGDEPVVDGAKADVSISEKETTVSKSTKELSSTNTYTGAYKACFTTLEALEGAGDRTTLNKLYGVYLAHTTSMKNAYSSDVLLNVGLQALRISYQATKRKQLRNLAGYYNGTLDRLLDRLYFVDIQKSYV